MLSKRITILCLIPGVWKLSSLASCTVCSGCSQVTRRRRILLGCKHLLLALQHVWCLTVWQTQCQDFNNAMNREGTGLTPLVPHSLNSRKNAKWNLWRFPQFCEDKMSFLCPSFLSVSPGYFILSSHPVSYLSSSFLVVGVV